MHKSLSRRTFIRASGIAIGSSALPVISSSIATASAQQPVNAPTDVTRRLARYLVASNWDDIPTDVRTETVRSVFNWVGCCLGGARHLTADRALAAFAEFSGTPEATVLGRSERLDILHAALLNGITSHVLDYDDTHLETIIHPAGPVASAILGLGQRAPPSGSTPPTWRRPV